MTGNLLSKGTVFVVGALFVTVQSGLLGNGLAAAAAPNSPSTPGVTSSAINVGAISSQSGQLASDFGDFTPGVKAYFNMVNAQGGINGRKLNLAWNLDDAGSPSEFTSLAHALVNQDHAFAIMVSSYWFDPGFFKETGIPTFGYNVSNDWAGPPNLFAAGGSISCTSCVVPSWSYLLQRAKAKSVALLAYNVSTSRDTCATAFLNVQARRHHSEFSVPAATS